MKIVVVLSGGLDSAVLLHHLHATDLVEAVSFDYGQRHKKELASAAKIAKALGVKHDIVDLSSVGSLLSAGGSALLGGQPVPEGHYEHESMKATVVPNRNMIMLAVAGGVAMARGFNAVAYGAHAGDHAIYPDCRPAFTNALDLAMVSATTEPMVLMRPFIGMTKAAIVTFGHTLGVPFVDTWSCYQGGDVHCGLCGTCVERREAFQIAGVEDPTVYA